MTLAPRPVDIEIKPSRLLLAWIVAAHLLVFLLLLLSPLEGWERVAILAVVLLGAIGSFRRWQRSECQALHWREGGWLLNCLPEDEEGGVSVELVSHLCLAGLMVLVFRKGRQTHRLLLLPDSISYKERRLLRQLLLLGGVSSSSR
ncbi:MAG: hypothetical protein EP334_05660 [Gammaproteobacteria bacterium]|nr:MAG: hypothetical protein EP334_05660 [Gammaproteobacteria bacterium]